MKVIFAGTAGFAVPSLEALIVSKHELLAVVTQPDRSTGRDRRMQQTAVKQVAIVHGIPVFQPERMRELESIAQVKAFGPIEAMVVVAYGQKIPTDLLIWPKHGVVNVHGSILPKYRGAAPIQHALIAGETTTGVTTMLMDEGWDTGDILLQESVDIHPQEDAGLLTQRLALVGADLLLRTLEGLEDGSVMPVPQDHDLASIARSLARDAGVIDWSRTATDIANIIRGCTPKPGAFTMLGGTQIKVWKASVHDCGPKANTPGQIVGLGDDGIVVACGEGCVRLLEMQAESRRRMGASEFARGSKLSVGDRFEVTFRMPGVRTT